MKIGTRVRFVGKPDGIRARGRGKSPNVVWLSGGDVGTVTAFQSECGRCDCPGDYHSETCMHIAASYTVEMDNGYIAGFDLDDIGSDWERQT